MPPMVGTTNDKDHRAITAMRSDPDGTAGPKDVDTTVVGPDCSTSGETDAQKSEPCWEPRKKDGSATKKPSKSEEASGSGGAIGVGGAMTSGGGSQLRRNNTSTDVGG
ncbi:hypothetical protein KIL84_003078 [Mauremys mutica]|uniref:Uncharacterized protein n=1 Tax=Mauremys mutica TaxID=74926 RepID=A0A9D4AT71_9SAUR|nr:hypothetical protein KIL84_003078 [Mauremys mutica]